MFHSARWDWDHDLAGERVAVIGSAASAVQFVPEIVEDAPARSTCSSARPTGCCRSSTTPYTPEQLDAFRADPDADARVPGGGRAQREHGHDVRRPGRAIAEREAVGLAAIDVVEDPEVRRKLRPTHPVRLQAPAVLERLLPGVQRAEPRARHRPHRARHRERGRHGRRRDARGRHDHPRHRLRDHEVPLGDRRRSGAAGAISTTRGTTGRRPTSASRRRGSRTCSCSTARTRTTGRS